MSDTARKEIESTLNENMNPEQIRHVISVYRKDMENRTAGYDKQITAIVGRIRKGEELAPGVPGFVGQTPSKESTLTGNVIHYDKQGNRVK